MSEIYDCIIVGGGWAGLSAATVLVQHGRKVLLVERSRQLGGRAGSFWDDDFHEWLDTGPHAFIGAYKSALKMLEIWGVLKNIDFSIGQSIPWMFKDGTVYNLKLSGGRIKSAVNLLRFKGMSIADRIKSLKVANGLLFYNTNRIKDLTVREFLTKHGIRPRDCAGLWDSLTVAVMNVKPEHADVGILANALREGLLGDNSGTVLGIPVCPFKEMYCDAAEKYITENDALIMTGKDVRQLKMVGDEFVLHIGDSSYLGHNIILAVQPVDVDRIIPEKFRELDYFRYLPQFEYCPIAAIHLNYNKSVLESPFLMLPDSFVHWVFGRGKPDSSGWKKVSAVISAAPAKEELTIPALTEQVVEELKLRIFKINYAEIQAIKTIRTIRATAVLNPMASKMRSEAQSPIKGLFLAGDWCATGLPATIESAARSGILAAEKLLS